MDRLYSPWRSEYVSTNDKKIDGCVFCHIKIREPNQCEITCKQQKQEKNQSNNRSINKQTA